MESTNDSIAYLPKNQKFSLYENISMEDRSNYYRISTMPITKVAEDDMEVVSSMVTDECYLHHWEQGVYICSQCKNVLYSSTGKLLTLLHSHFLYNLMYFKLDKWKGPCVWPSFRKPHNEMSMKTIKIENYNGYLCDVFELYCLNCTLFIGHQFYDSREKGDGLHPECTGWRH